MAKSTEKTVKVLVFRDGKHLVAQCLEYNIVAQAKTMDKLKTAFAGTFLAYEMLSKQSGTDVFSDLPKAPQKYWDLFKKASVLQDRQPLPRPSGSRPRLSRRHANSAQYAAVI